MKKLLALIVLIQTCSICIGQSWTTVGNGLNNGGYLNTLYVYDSVLYMGGVFTSPGNNVAQWNGTKLDSLGPGTNGEVSAFSYYKGKVYMGGFFSKAGGHSAGCVAAWNDSTLNNAGFDIEGGAVTTMQVYDSVLYVLGMGFDSVSHVFLSSEGAVLWNDTVPKPMGSIPFLVNFTSSALYNGSLYTGQLSDCIQTWNNVHLTINEYFSGAYNGGILSMVNYRGNLIAGGIFSSPGPNIAISYGSYWNNIGVGVNGPVYALAVYKNYLFVGGDFDSAGGIPASNVAMWDGSKWYSLGVLENGLNGPVYALAVFNGDLYAGGAFTSPGIGIAEFAGPLAVNILTNSSEATIYPNPTDGKFTITIPKENRQSEIQIYNILGEKIYSSILLNENTFLNLEKQTAGIYLYRILAHSGDLIDSGKLVIE